VDPLHRLDRARGPGPFLILRPEAVILPARRSRTWHSPSPRLNEWDIGPVRPDQCPSRPLAGPEPRPARLDEWRFRPARLDQCPSRPPGWTEATLTPTRPAAPRGFALGRRPVRCLVKLKQGREVRAWRPWLRVGGRDSRPARPHEVVPIQPGWTKAAPVQPSPEWLRSSRSCGSAFRPTRPDRSPFRPPGRAGAVTRSVGRVAHPSGQAGPESLSVHRVGRESRRKPRGSGWHRVWRAHSAPARSSDLLP
jgi:hypothetical protein